MIFFDFYKIIEVNSFEKKENLVMIMKYINAFLKKLKTDRNTFVTYVLTLMSIYICIDRITEILFLIFSGLSVDYWGPIKYTLALACPIFAFYFSFASKFVKDKYTKTSFFYIYAVALLGLVVLDDGPDVCRHGLLYGGCRRAVRI